MARPETSSVRHPSALLWHLSADFSFRLTSVSLTSWSSFLSVSIMSSSFRGPRKKLAIVMMITNVIVILFSFCACRTHSGARVRGDFTGGRPDVGGHPQRVAHRPVQRGHRRDAALPLRRRPARARNPMVERPARPTRWALRVWLSWPMVGRLVRPARWTRRVWLSWPMVGRLVRPTRSTLWVWRSWPMVERLARPTRWAL